MRGKCGTRDEVDAKSKRRTKGVRDARQVDTREMNSAESAERKGRGNGVHSVGDEGEERWGKRMMRKVKDEGDVGRDNEEKEGRGKRRGRDRVDAKSEAESRSGR